jgi:two-component system capsular synthesis response regulator RcsB
MLKMRAGITLVGEASTPTLLFELLQRTPCDLLITDLAMPEPSGETEDGPGMIRRLRRDWAQLRIVVMTTLTNTPVLRAIVSDGAISVLSKTESMSDLWRAIDASARGETYLSRAIVEALTHPLNDADRLLPVPRLSAMQAEIVQRYVDGQSIAEIAAALGCHHRKVSRKKREAMTRLGVTTDSGLFSRVRAQGL